MVKELKSLSLNVQVTDPHAESDEVKHEYGFELDSNIGNDYDAVLITVPHQAYRNLDDAYFAGITKPKALIADLKETTVK